MQPAHLVVPVCRVRGGSVAEGAQCVADAILDECLSDALPVVVGRVQRLLPLPQVCAQQYLRMDN